MNCGGCESTLHSRCYYCTSSPSRVPHFLIVELLQAPSVWCVVLPLTRWTRCLRRAAPRCLEFVVPSFTDLFATVSVTSNRKSQLVTKENYAHSSNALKVEPSVLHEDGMKIPTLTSIMFDRFPPHKNSLLHVWLTDFWIIQKAVRRTAPLLLLLSSLYISSRFLSETCFGLGPFGPRQSKTCAALSQSRPVRSPIFLIPNFFAASRRTLFVDLHPLAQRHHTPFGTAHSKTSQPWEGFSHSQRELLGSLLHASLPCQRQGPPSVGSHRCWSNSLTETKAR